ncbi:hypothetical protein GGR52DRAFT_529828 [Hypoxylon sp. FL1284]|nr:hypothetical protein GGR52DRAFT_529828 [Hypoxylon sp. FL1284]
MFTCKACLRRAFASIASHTNQSLHPYKYPATLPPLSSRRHKTTYAEAGASARGSRQDESRQPDRRSSKVSHSRQWAAKKELQYLNDPFLVARFVRQTLGNGDFEKAALVTRGASKNMKVVVSWNHLIDYLLRNDRIHAAIKLYNDMKKRAQLPNAQTFTIIFRGLAGSSHPKLAVSEAIRIFSLMLHSESRVKPNTIHMNAVLQVCAKAGDIDALFTIAERANDGIRAPNNLTYTTIINALRSSVVEPRPEALNDVEARTAREQAGEQAIRRAKSLWQEVISKWRAGSLIIDEELVCAMGRILLIGGYHDADSVETLLEQTMMIPRDKTATVKGPSANMSPPGQGDSRKAKAPGAPAISYPAPGSNSLSMILQALEQTRKTTKAEHYWLAFTKVHGVVPDADNWYQLLITFLRGKNSAKTVQYLQHLPPSQTAPKNFRTAMYTCLRDNLNPSAFDHATKVLTMMLTRCQTPDALTMLCYLKVAYANRRFREENKDEQAATAALGKQLTKALKNIEKPYLILEKQYRNDKPNSTPKQRLITLARKMVATCDRLVFGKMVPPAVVEEYIKPMRNSVNRTTVRHFEQMAEIDPNYRPLDKDSEDGGSEDKNWEDEEEFTRGSKS